MARCGCAGTGCSCYITGAGSTSVTGSGTAANPFVIAVDGEASDTIIEVTDTSSLNLTITGDGSVGTPYNISGTVVSSGGDIQSMIPVLDSLGTDPTRGNGNWEMWWTEGDFIQFTCKIIRGSTGTNGTGQYRLTLPAAADPTSAFGFFSVSYYDDSAAAYWRGGTGHIVSNQVLLHVYDGNASGALDPFTPTSVFTMTTGDAIYISGFYKSA